MKSPKILIDATPYVEKRAPGFNYYLINLLKGIADTWAEDMEITLCVRKDQLNVFLNFQSAMNIKLVNVNSVKGRVLWQNLILPFQLYKYDLILSPANFSPFFMPCKSVVVIHDLNFLIYPKNFGKLSYFYRSFMVKRSILKSTKCISISKQVFKEIEDYTGVKSKVIYNPVNKISANHILKNCLSTKYNVVIPSSLAVHKNIESAYLAALEFVKNHADVSFYFIGNWSVDEFPLKNNHERVKVLGYVDEALKNSLFLGCNCILVPSTYEGFGLPYAEAIVLDKELICCDIPIAREIASSYPHFISYPYKTENIIEALSQAYKNNFKSYKKSNEILERYNRNSVALKYLSVVKEAICS